MIQTKLLYKLAPLQREFDIRKPITAGERFSVHTLDGNANSGCFHMAL